MKTFQHHTTLFFSSGARNFVRIKGIIDVDIYRDNYILSDVYAGTLRMTQTSPRVSNAQV